MRLDKPIRLSTQKKIILLPGSCFIIHFFVGINEYYLIQNKILTKAELIRRHSLKLFLRIAWVISPLLTFLFACNILAPIDGSLKNAIKLISGIYMYIGSCLLSWLWIKYQREHMGIEE